MADEKLTEAEMMIRLRERYSPPEWAFLPQVRSGTGAYGGTTADAIAMNTWPSKGCELHGLEIKVSRSDWLRERKNGAKAERIARYCDRWWIVAARGIVEEDELPKGWGLIETWGDGLRRSVQAPLQDTEPLDLPFVAAILRRAQGCHEDDSAIRAAERAAYDRAKKSVEDRLQKDVDYWKGRHDEVVKRVQEFQEGTGLQVLGGWSGDGRIQEVAEAVKATRETNPKRYDSAIRRVQRIREQAEAILEQTAPLLSPNSETEPEDER